MNLWRAVEAVPGLVDVADVWRQHLADDYDRAAPLLRATGVLAESVWRGGASPWTIVHHGDDDIVAVCPDTHETVSVSRSDLVLFELDLQAICVALSCALKLNGVPQQAGGKRLWWLGHQPWSDTEQINVYLVLPPARSRAAEILRAAALRSPKGGVLLVPTAELIPADIQSELAVRDYALQPLEGLVVWAGVGKLACVRAPNDVIPAVLGRHPLERKRRGSRSFPTPAGAKWSELHIQFIDPETVKITVRGVVEEHTAASMGMVVHRTGRPTKQWNFLQEIARRNGRWRWGDLKTRATWQKQKEELVKRLKSFCGISGTPILTARVEWRCVFPVRPDGL
ncbi:MAG: hypothetical protein IT436_13420 [Phycisphaerales bacterium]|nr:hypothetical protein [Phycisphaerales bacterium]